jgi:hypothetical protein
MALNFGFRPESCKALDPGRLNWSVLDLTSSTITSYASVLSIIFSSLSNIAHRSQHGIQAFSLESTKWKITTSIELKFSMQCGKAKLYFCRGRHILIDCPS